MATLGRRIEPKPSTTAITEAIPLLLVPVARQPAVAIPTQFIPRTIFIDAQSLQANMDSNREALRVKLERRPAQGHLIQRGILPAEGGDRRKSVLRSKERDALKRKIEQRPSKQKLVTQHILLTASNADPSIQRKAEELKRCKLKDDLNKKLQHRPGPLELITKKILQADAELEQAIQEGRLLFTKTTQRKGENEEKQSEMEVISATSSCAYQRKLPNVCLTKSKVRKKGSQYRTPYDQTLPSPNARSKLKLQDSASSDYQSTETINDALVTHGVSYVSDNASLLNVGEQSENTREIQSSYDLLLQQQQLFLQWQREVEESRALGTSQEEEGRHCPDECATSSATSPCMTSSAQSSLIGTDCAQNGVQSVISEQMQETQQSCQCSSANFNYSGISSGTINSVSDNEKPRTRLADYRVQDLKNECKKRQLPVSGAKPQLLERLRPYEESILNHFNGTTVMDPSSDLISVSSPAPDVSIQSNRLPPISNVIGDHVHKHSTSPLIQRTQSAQQHSLVVQLPPAQQHQHQVLHLVDASGAVVATATVPHNVQCCCMSSEYPLTNDITLNGTTTQSTSIRSQQQLSSTTEVTQNMAQQVQTEPTFSFAQLGSGGQFTLVRTSSVEQLQQQASPHIMHSSQTGHHHHHHQHHQQQQQQTQPIQNTVPGNPVFNCLSSRSAISPEQRLAGGLHQMTEIPSRSTHEQQQTQAQIQHAGTGTAICPVVKQQNCHSQFLICNNVMRHNSKDGTTVSQNALCPPLQSAQPHCSPVMADSASGSSPDIPSPPNNSEKITVKKHPAHIDPSDTSALLSATTLSIHEEMLRFQQRKIEELQKELHRSQQQLKHQQQVILAAKKAQQAKRQEDAQLEGNQQQSEADLWLNQLDIKHLNKFHIQLFLQHKLQQQQMQAQITEQQNLASTEEKLQEELHVEQAVQDIVRLIKQDARTALLIVQLLRRYQLERSHAVAAVAQVTEDQSCGIEVQHSVQADPNTLEPVTVVTSQHQCVSLADIAMESIQNTSQQKTGVTVIIEDELQRYAPTSTPHSKPKSRKKNIVSRAKASDSHEKISGSVDMEEIFKQVLENASKALLESDAKKRSKTDLISSPSCFSDEFQIQKTAASSPLRQHQSDNCRIEGNSGSNSTALPSCDQLMQPYISKTSPASTVYSVKQRMETDMTDGHFEERVEVFEEGAVDASQTFQYSKNQAFDDLMDVLRDDQAGANDLKSNNLDFGTGTVYRSDELATLLGDDWFQHDCAIPATSVCSQATEQYTVNSPDVLNEKTDNQDEQTSNQNDPLMVSFDHNQVVDQFQNIGMDWLDMMLPSPSPDMDTSETDLIQ